VDPPDEVRVALRVLSATHYGGEERGQPRCFGPVCRSIGLPQKSLWKISRRLDYIAFFELFVITCSLHGTRAVAGKILPALKLKHFEKGYIIGQASAGANHRGHLGGACTRAVRSPGISALRASPPAGPEAPRRATSGQTRAHEPKRVANALGQHARTENAPLAMAHAADLCIPKRTRGAEAPVKVMSPDFMAGNCLSALQVSLVGRVAC
jgi:hypothetical protein